jgi:hypothetical protein
VRAVAFLDADFGAEFAGQHTPLLVARALASEEQEVPGESVGQIIGDRLCQHWQH